jgi:DNA-binding LytR/AlgR family response regulator
MAMKTIHVGSRLHIAPESIVFIKADISYSHIFLSDGRKILVSTHLMKLERRFGDKMVRVHRSYLVNPEADIEITEKEFTTPLGHKGLISRRLKKNLMF